MAMSAEQEVEKMRILEDRITAPSVWGRVSCGVRFEDCQEKRYDDVIRMLKKHYLPEELTYRSVKISEDKEGVDEFVHNVRIWMKDKMSVVAIKEGTDQVVGALLMRIQDRQAFSRTFSRTKLTYNPKYSAVMTFYNKVEEPVNIFEEMNVQRYLKVYILALKTRYRHRSIGKQMLKGAMGLAASAFVPVLSGIFLTARLQAIAEDLGFLKLNEIYYVRYIVNEQVVIWDTGKGNHGAALMAYRIPDVEEPVEEMKAQTSSRFAIQPAEEAAEEEEGELKETAEKEEILSK